MKRYYFYLLLCMFLLAVMISAPGKVEAETRFITIGTGGVTGIYYPTGGAIARIVNRSRDKHGLRCMVESTEGSAYNIDAVLSGELQFGIAQSDRQYQAFRGLAEWEDDPQENLRAIFSLQKEHLTLIVSEESGIRGFADLRGKRVNIGNEGSGTRQQAIDALTVSGIDPETDIEALSIEAADAPGLLQDGRMDAFFYTVGHPSGAIQEATTGEKKVRFISIGNVDRMLVQYPYYTKLNVPVDLYRGAIRDSRPVATIGVTATFVTSADVSENVVYVVTKQVFENFEAFKKLHPALGGLQKTEMIKPQTVPFHPGALKYFREAGLMK